MPDTTFFMGLELGQSQDYTAICVVEIARPEFGVKPLHQLKQRQPLDSRWMGILTKMICLAE